MTIIYIIYSAFHPSGIDKSNTGRLAGVRAGCVQ